MQRSRPLIDEPSDARRVTSPVPKPSIPGISSPKLREDKTVTYPHFIGIRVWKREKGHPPLDSLLWRLALELARLPLLELGRSFTRGGRASADTGG